MRHSIVGAPILVALAASTAHAAFSQLTCPANGPYGPRIAVNFGATEFDKQPQMSMIGTASDFTLYQNSVNPFGLEVLTNSNVQFLYPLFGYFVTESNYDYLEVTDDAGQYRYTGAINSDTSGNEVGWYRGWSPRPNSGGPRSFNLRWNADVSVAAWIPPRITGVQPSCATNQTATAVNNKLLSLNTRYDGILLGTHDVIYTYVMQPAWATLVVTLDGKGAAGDIDLFASTASTTPDYASAATQISQTGTPNEALEIAPVSYPRYVYIGVYGYNGGGHFALNVLAQNERHSLNVCPINFTPTTAERATITTFLRRGSARMLAGSNGNLLVKNFTIWPQQPAPCTGACDICLENIEVKSRGSTAWNHTCGVIELARGFWSNNDGLGLFHELGHSCYGLLDEYQGEASGPATVSNCGHSVMNNDQTAMFCSTHHCLDGHQYNPGLCNPNSNSDWAYINSRIAYGPHYGNTTSATPNDFSQNQQLLNLINVF